MKDVSYAVEEQALRPSPFEFNRMGRVMTEKPENKHEVKTRETREALLRAAETVFARDGYQGAELGEIAALAGRTKGAIYAQFKSKEDIFLALVDVNRRRYQEEMARLLSASTTVQGNLEVLRTFYHRIAENRTWRLLLLEFKLFAIRHPEAKARFESLMAESLSVRDEERIAGTLGRAPADGVSRVVAILSLQPMVSALALEAEFEGALDGETLSRVVDEVFDRLMGIGSKR